MVAVEDRDQVMCCCVLAERVVVNEFLTDPDLAYQFNTQVFGKQPKWIYSRAQYKRLLKENKMVDASPKECMQIKPHDNTYKRRQVVKKMTEKMRADGVLSHVPSFLKDIGAVKDPKWKRTKNIKVNP